MTLQIIPAFASQYVAARQVEIWLPPGYHTDSRRLPVLYMHDGQNVFNPNTSTHKVPWGVDETLTRLHAAGQIGKVIVVAVWSLPATRIAEYMPAKAFDTPRGKNRLKHFTKLFGPPRSDAYLQFIVKELKAHVDQTYRTIPEPTGTFLMGSSMGSVISLYALCEYPDVFGGAACLSTHWPIGEGILVDYVRAALPAPGQHKLYFDYGTLGIDRPYEPYQHQVDAHLRAAGYRLGVDWITKKFAGADHNEAAWRARLEHPIQFLFSKTFASF